jgi:hypothetical protein
MPTVGSLLFLITLALRGASVNRFVRSRLTISCALFAIYAADSALVVFGRLPGSVADQIRTANPLLLESSSGVRFGKVDVVRDHLRRRARQEVEQHRVHGAGPRPEAGVRLEVAEGVLVDFDERDVRACRLRPGRAAETPVAGLQLDELERAEAAARPGDEEPIADPDERRRAEANQDTSLHAPIV